MVFCFVQNFFFRTTQELDCLFFLSRNARIGNQNIFLEKNHTPPPFKLNGRSLIYDLYKCYC